ncbi:hypothetical protein F5148DRAFT_1262231 [Russula earlei]|uniref:Uncharacterized protein n=1 Tax=Russula earlei TaxID=71964 RepID=A0ACC0TRV7_9AGAM|nr:hypothetical protein F5148DRAFT_1262231 [Russula earlei]
MHGLDAALAADLLTAAPLTCVLLDDETLAVDPFTVGSDVAFEFFTGADVMLDSLALGAIVHGKGDVANPLPDMTLRAGTDDGRCKAVCCEPHQ